MTLSVEMLKQYAVDNGADLVGVACAGSFENAPEGHKPEDILSGAKTVVVCAKRIPKSIMESPSTAYHRVMEVVHDQLDKLALKITLFLEQNGIKAVPVPSDVPYRYWNEKKQHGRGDLSHKHAAQAAGLGKIGKNSLLITQQFGNCVHLVSIVTDSELTPDPLLEWEPCPQDCSLCKDVCPGGAITEDQYVDQALCRPVAMETLPNGTVIESCCVCRYVCPAGK